ncbi:hypothetical protein CBR_g29778 [Chara braunii]|uniref:Reverse transcriptase domain-containing protein n=1 Tax=Chara braunii TaxID=69332 RepID=A0A388LBE7_CHABU|nr:hypothetical protein CBR_g29778 [Chara braunii]|eukprot:GBG79628.1 hypothetical protein CBR_g29778 [Chara braunii]
MNVTYQHFVNKTWLTQGMINFCVIVYTDNILVYSETYHGHAQHIEWTLGALRDAGFTIALEKSEFFLSEISFLGYVVTRGGLRPDSRKVAVVKDASVPTSVTQVRAFLGLPSYYRRFIKGFAAIARPLTNLLRKDQPLSWDAECEQAFATLKGALATTPILIRSDPMKQFILITDWQPEAISAILAQKGSDGREHVIEYASRTVPDERRNDSAPQGECYAVEYDFDIIHRKAERHGNADGLTCLHRPTKLTWTRDTKHRTWIEYVELLIIQAWRTEVEGDLGFLFGSVHPDHRQQIVQELTIPLAQLADDLPFDIVSQCDKSPVPHVLSRTLTPYLQWSACLEEPGSNNNPPSQQQYLDPRGIIYRVFFQPRTASKDEVIRLEEEEEKDEEGGDEEEEEKTPKEGSYSEHSEGEQSDEEEEEDQSEEEEESEWETLGEEADHTEPHEEDPEAVRRREEIAAAKQSLEFASGLDLPIPNDPAKDPEPPKNDNGDLVAKTSSAPARRRRSRSPSPSTSARPPVRARTDAGHRASSPVLIPSPSPPHPPPDRYPHHRPLQSLPNRHLPLLLRNPSCCHGSSPSFYLVCHPCLLSPRPSLQCRVARPQHRQGLLHDHGDYPRMRKPRSLPHGAFPNFHHPLTQLSRIPSA